jgi:hypothetical protein
MLPESAAMKAYEFEPTEKSAGPRAYHREDSAVLTCAACGCRLIARESRADGGGYGPDAAWRHFVGRSPDRDARGCLVECVDLAHRIFAEEAEA